MDVLLCTGSRIHTDLEKLFLALVRSICKSNDMRWKKDKEATNRAVGGLMV